MVFCYSSLNGPRHRSLVFRVVPLVPGLGGSDGKKSACNAGDPGSILVVEKTLESCLDNEEIQSVNPRENQPFQYSLEGLMMKLKFQNHGHIMWRANLIGKDPDAEKDWGQEEKGATEDEMVGWHHWLNGHEFEQTLGDSEGQRSLVVHGVAESQTQLSD